jgi:ribosome-associated toxin RatA of RatAB toxin-antitoxin module
MRKVTLTANIAQDASSVYEALADFNSYPLHMSSVRKVDVLTRLGSSCTSAWEVQFRNGLLKWTEQDDFDHNLLRITFAQIQGDLEAFSGHWQVSSVDTGCLVTFSAVFDLGIPSLAAFLEPVAQNAIEENVCKVLRGLFGAQGLVGGNLCLDADLGSLGAAV